MRLRLKTIAAAGVVAVVVGGCGTPAALKSGEYWLVHVGGDYANIYLYPVTDKPGAAAAVSLGTTQTEERAHLKAAAKTLGVPVGHVTNETGS